MAMRDEIYDAIMKGGATKESLLELTGTTDKGLASQFTYLRMMGKCPMKQDDGTFKIVSAEEWAERSKGGGPAVSLTPEERLEKAEKREKRAATAYDTAQKRCDSNPSELNDLKLIKADAELKIASLELNKAETAVFEAEENKGAEEVEVVDDVENEDEMEDVDVDVNDIDFMGEDEDELE